MGSSSSQFGNSVLRSSFFASYVSPFLCSFFLNLYIWSWFCVLFCFRLTIRHKEGWVLLLLFVLCSAFLIWGPDFTHFLDRYHFLFLWFFAPTLLLGFTYVLSQVLLYGNNLLQLLPLAGHCCYLVYQILGEGDWACVTVWGRQNVYASKSMPQYWRNYKLWKTHRG